VAANLAALEALNAERDTPIKIRQNKYSEQHHRTGSPGNQASNSAHARVFKTFRCARILLGGIELMHMIKKGAVERQAGEARLPAEQFYSLVK